MGSNKFKQIEEKLLAGADYDSVQDDLNNILGPVDETENDPESDSDWEFFYRNSKF
jgi:hypothetical protein